MCAGTAPSYCPVAVTRYLLETLRYEARNTVHESTNAKACVSESGIGVFRARMFGAWICVKPLTRRCCAGACPRAGR